MRPASRSWAAALLLLSLSCTAAGQFTLTTTFAGGNAQSGNMFDIEATGGVPLRIQSFDINTSGAGLTIEVYVVTAGTTYVGNETNAGAWTMIASVLVNGAGAGIATPLNLTLNHSLPVGVRRGFYVTQTVGSMQYTNGTSLGSVFASNSTLTFYEGIGKSYPFGSTFSPRIFNGNIHYGFDQNILTLSQSGPGVGDLTVSIGNLSPTAIEGWTILSTVVTQPVATGPFFGLHPDFWTWDILGYPYFPGNPFHFRTTDVGLYPGVPFVAPPGSVSSLVGQTMDFVALMLNSTSQYDSQTNVVRFMFQ